MCFYPLVQNVLKQRNWSFCRRLQEANRHLRIGTSDQSTLEAARDLQESPEIGWYLRVRTTPLALPVVAVGSIGMIRTKFIGISDAASIDHGLARSVRSGWWETGQLIALPRFSG